MSDDSADVLPAGGEPAPQLVPVIAVRREWLAVAAVICVAVFPDMFDAFAMYSHATTMPEVSFAFDVFHLIVRSIQVAVPVLVIATLANTDWRSIGIVRFRWFDPLCGAFVWMVSMIVLVVFQLWISMILPSLDGARADLAAYFQRPSSWPDYGLLVVGSIANGFAEELVMRGYLLTRLELLLASTWRALLITSLLFAAYHIYQGLGGAIEIFGLGLFYGLAFCVFRRLWPVAVAHAIADVVGWLMV